MMDDANAPALEGEGGASPTLPAAVKCAERTQSGGRVAIADWGFGATGEQDVGAQIAERTQWGPGGSLPRRLGDRRGGCKCIGKGNLGISLCVLGVLCGSVVKCAERTQFGQEACHWGFRIGDCGLTIRGLGVGRVAEGDWANEANIKMGSLWGSSSSFLFCWGGVVRA